MVKHNVMMWGFWTYWNQIWSPFLVISVHSGVMFTSIIIQTHDDFHLFSINHQFFWEN